MTGSRRAAVEDNMRRVIADLLYDHTGLIDWACGCGHAYSWSQHGGDILRAQAAHQADVVITHMHRWSLGEEIV